MRASWIYCSDKFRYVGRMRRIADGKHIQEAERQKEIEPGQQHDEIPRHQGPTLLLSLPCGSQTILAIQGERLVRRLGLGRFARSLLKSGAGISGLSIIVQEADISDIMGKSFPCAAQMLEVDANTQVGANLVSVHKEFSVCLVILAPVIREAEQAINRKVILFVGDRNARYIHGCCAIDRGM